MDVTFISDTHGLHQELKIESGTLLIHAGDITEYGTEEEVMDFLLWFSRQRYTYKIFIAGNHDLFLEECSVAKRKKIMTPDIIYLQNSGVKIEGVKIWGSPVTPYFLGMAFNARAGKEIKKVWNKIPDETDILVTHGPPKGILDNGFGCEALLQRVNEIKPACHCFGHIHGWNNIEKYGQVTFINAAMVNELAPLQNDAYKIIGQPACLTI